MPDSSFFVLSNLAMTQAKRGSPWKFTPDVPESVRATKEKYRDWLASVTTQHCLYSCSEGSLGGVRVSRDNPIVKIHGFIADYDVRVTEEMLRDSLANRPGEFFPNYEHATPSGGRRLIWLFQTPALVLGSDMAKRFSRIVAKRIKAKNFLPGLDTDALSNPAIYYDVGTAWHELNTERIPEEHVFLWLYEAGQQTGRESFAGPAIPLPEVQKEMDSRFPGRWVGEFAVGASGPRFWDAAADNPRACVVSRYGTGMQCFTGATAFMPWAAIFGAAFVEKYKADSYGEVLANTWYDGQTYWRKLADDQWYPWQREDFKIYLRVQHQVSMQKAPDRGCSEMDEVFHQVHEQKRVNAALPFVYLPDGLLYVDNERYLNTSTVRVLPPAEEDAGEWGQKFPWLAEFFTAFFKEKTPLNYFLAWLYHAYVPAMQQTPHSGQVVLIAGDVGRGKTLLSTVIVSRLLGGSADASSFFLGEEKFTGHILKKPLMTVDDTAPATSSNRHVRYTSMLKKVVANSDHTFEQKFRNAGKIRWLGRVMITCNSDPESIRLLPGMDMSNADKISLFRCNWDGKFPMVFPSRGEISRAVDRELPYFARWLADWEVPAECRGSSRMGALAYHDTTLLENSAQASDSFSFLEVLQLFLRDYSGLGGAETHWVGTATDLLAQMNQNEGLRSLLSRISPHKAARCLGKLISEGFPIEHQHTRLARIWSIPMDLAGKKGGQV